MSEPDYTINIAEKDGGWIVCEGGEEISRVFESKEEAMRWERHHVQFYQPRCCVCGSAEKRPDDPWEVIAVSCTGSDWVHTTCTEKTEINFTKLGFTLRGNGEMRPPSNSRTTLTCRDGLYELKIAPCKDKAVIIFFREDDVLVSS